MLTAASGGTVAWSWDPEPFGNGQPTGTFTYNLRFPGQYYDRETGLHHNGFRDYHRDGRYIQSDPVGLAAGLNTYAYVNSNPLRYIDADGLLVGDPATFAVATKEAVATAAGVASATAAAIVGGVLMAVYPSSIADEPITAQSHDPIAPPPSRNTLKDPSGEYCRSLARRIENLKDEIYNKRYPDLESNPRGLPYRIGPHEKFCETVRGHEKLLNQKLRELREAEDEYDHKCKTAY